MKKFIIIILFFLSTASNQIGAQVSNHELSTVYFYERVNQNYMSFQGLEREKLQFKAEFTALLGYNYYFAKNLSLQAGLAYSKRGFVTENTDFTSTYLQVPLQLRLDVIRDRDNIRLMPYAGVYMGFGINSKKVVIDNTIYSDNNPSDFGLELGLNTAYKVNNTFGVILLPRLQYGLTRVYQESPNEKRSNFSYSLGIGLNFSIIKNDRYDY